MLFSKAADYLTDQIGLPSRVEGPPRRLWSWMLARQHGHRELFEVKLRDGPAPGAVSVVIIDPLAGFLGSEEELTMLQETDFKVALGRVQAHVSG